MFIVTISGDIFQRATRDTNQFNQNVLQNVLPPN